jgi:hypothetical protein
VRTSTVRAFIALTVVGVFMLITAVLALFPLLTRGDVDLKGYADFFAKTASVYTGIVGVIIGYYFARRQDLGASARNDRTNSSQPGAEERTGADVILPGSDTAEGSR